MSVHIGLRGPAVSYILIMFMTADRTKILSSLGGPFQGNLTVLKFVVEEPIGCFYCANIGREEDAQSRWTGQRLKDWSAQVEAVGCINTYHFPNNSIRMWSEDTCRGVWYGMWSSLHLGQMQRMKCGWNHVMLWQELGLWNLGKEICACGTKAKWSWEYKPTMQSEGWSW